MVVVELGLYSSVQDADPAPPNANPAFCVPAPANIYLAVDKALPADHDVPSYSSVHDSSFISSSPPNANAADCIPAAAKLNLAVDKLPPDDHEAPLYSSVIDTLMELLPS